MPVVFLLVYMLLHSCALSERSPLSEIWMQYPVVELEARLSHVDMYQDSLVQRLSLLEIGVSSGRSMLSWIKWFEDVEKFVYVGVDSVKHFLDISDEDDVHIEIQPVIDTDVLNSICAVHGPFDVVIDNGHYSGMSIVSLKNLFPCVSEEGFYIIENAMTPHLSDIQKLTMAHFVADVYTDMHNSWIETEEYFFDPVFSEYTKCIQLMQNTIVLEKGPIMKYNEILRGIERIPLHSNVGLKFFSEQQSIEVSVDLSSHSSTIPHEKIKAQCREICAEVPFLVSMFSSVEECAKGMKRKAIHDGFASYDGFLYGND